MRTGDGRRDPTTLQARPPLVGRDDDRARLVEALVAGRNLLLEGPAGVGKTRLTEEVLEAPELRPRPRDRLLACAGTTGVALAAMLPLVTGRSARDDLGSQIEWYLARWRSQRSADGPTLVCVDDVHHLDDVSAAVIRQAVASGDVQLLGTLRANEAVGDDILALLVDGTMDRVGLGPLEPGAARRLAAWCAPGPQDAARAAQVARLAAGNPLFVRELALNGGSVPPTGAGRAVLRERLQGLSPAVRRAAELVALAQPVPTALLAHREPELDALRRAGLVVGVEPDRVRLDHPLRAECLVQELGSEAAGCYGELASRAVEMPGLVDPLLEVEWQLEAGQTLDPARAARVVRLALARSDVRTARRLIAHVGDEHDLLLGQVLAVEGDLDRALALLEEVRGGAADPALRVEAASLLVRHLGVTRSDFAAAHEVLDRTDTPELGADLRRHLLLGRVWLRIFGPDLGPPVLPTDDQLRSAVQHTDPLAFDLAVGCAAFFCHTGQVDGATAFMERALAIEPDVELDEGSWGRARSTEAWWYVYLGDVAAARRTIEASADRARAQGWQEIFALLIGNAALMAMLAGSPEPDLVLPGWDHRALRRTGSPDDDPYRLEALAHASLRACCLLADPAGPCACREHELVDSGGAMPLQDAIVALPQDLARSGVGADRGARLPSAIRALADNDLRGWVAIFYLLGCGLGTPLVEHRLVVEWLGPEATGLCALARDAARARVEDDPAALLDVGVELASRGFVLPASRVLADVTRLRPDVATGLRAVRCLSAVCVAWSGAPMPWTADVVGLPTPRQLEIARAVTAGATVAEVAERMFLSRRTVENHLYRVARCLETTSREELGEILTGPCRGPSGTAGSPNAAEPSTADPRVQED